MTHKIDSTGTTAVCTKTAWMPIDNLWGAAVGGKKMGNYKSHIYAYLKLCSATTEKISNDTGIPKDATLSALSRMKRVGLVDGEKILQGHYWVYIWTLKK